MATERRLVNKYRSQLFVKWLEDTYPLNSKSRILDIAGGKGLITYILNDDGYHSVVMDPMNQELPRVYRDLNKKRYRIPEDEKVLRTTKAFEIEDAKNRTLLIGMHAHGVNMKIMDAAIKNKINFAILPCCVIDEPIERQENIDWFDSLVDYGKSIGLEIQTTNINFTGQNKIIYTTQFN